MPNQFLARIRHSVLVNPLDGWYGVGAGKLFTGWWAHVHSLWVLVSQLWCVFRSCQLPGLALKDLPNSRDHFHPHAFPAFLILPGKVRSEKAEECS